MIAKGKSTDKYRLGKFIGSVSLKRKSTGKSKGNVSLQVGINYLSSVSLEVVWVYR